jgi:hypothetical protein
MRRDQLEHAIRTACQIIGRHEVIVVAALVRSALVDRETILSRLTTMDERYRPAAELAASWLRSLETSR